MNIKRRLMITIVMTLMIVTACDNSVDQSPVEPDDKMEKLETSQVEDKKDDLDGDVNKTEITDQEETSSDPSDDLVTEEGSEDQDHPSGVTVNQTEYLEKLNQMEEADRHAESGSTIAELEEQETARYQKWDEELNRIYGILTEQLSTGEMDDLREEQREWIVFRDQSAKEASLKYEGGTTESLEYIATQASLTRERCYLLVAQYLD